MTQAPRPPAKPSAASGFAGLLIITLAVCGIVMIVRMLFDVSAKNDPTPTPTPVATSPETTAMATPTTATSSLSQMELDRVPPSGAPQETDTGPVVRAGSYCTHLGDHARTSAGTTMRCSLSTDGRKRWTRS